MKSKIVLGLVLVALSACGRGPTGYSGVDGKPGNDGQDGEDAQQITVVKFCPGVTTYPSKFVEIGFCISGKLYATYSSNGGFSTEIPPGSYGSNGINSSCNFVVLPNCGIQN